MIKKIVAIIIAILMIALLAVSCKTNGNTLKTQVNVNDTQGTTSQQSKSDDIKKEIKEIVMCESSDFSGGFSTFLTTKGVGFMYYFGNFYETLINYDNGKIEPGLAESWEVNNNEITFYLREGVKFSDGSDFNAEVVKVTFEMIPKVLGEQYANNFGVLSKLEEVEVIDDYTVKLKLSEPYYAALQELTMVRPMAMISLNAFTEEGLSDETYSKTFGTGPYMLDSFVEGQDYTFVRNDNYWGEQPAVEQFVVKVIPDMESRIMALRSGEIDIVVGSNKITYDAFSEFKNGDKFTAKVSESIVKTRDVLLNTTKEPFDDKKVRLAVQYAVDKQSICDNVLYGIEDKADYFLNFRLPYCEVNIEPYVYDKREAEELLEAAGWLKVEGSDIRKKDGQELEAEILFRTGKGVEEDIALTLAAQLREVGFDIKATGLELLNWCGKAAQGKFAMSISETYGIPYDPYTIMRYMGGCSPDNAAQQGLSNKPEIDLQISKLSNIIDEVKIQEIYDYILITLHEEGVTVPISYMKELVIYNNEKIKEYKFNGQPTNIHVSGIVPN